MNTAPLRTGPAWLATKTTAPRKRAKNQLRDDESGHISRFRT